MNDYPIMAWAIVVSGFMLMIALLLTLFRLARGPDLPDRVVALDEIGMIVIGFVAHHMVASRQTAYFTIAIILALVAFLGTVAVARYLERSTR